MIVLVSGLTFKSYCENPSVALSGEHLCPCCGIRRLTRHDAYLRWVYEPLGRVLIRIFRRRCRPCKITVTLLPDFLVPYFRYLGETIEAAVGAYLSSDRSYRGVALAVSGATLPSGVSITDALMFTSTSPSYQRVFAWVVRLCALAESYASAFMAWCLRTAADHMVLHDLATDTRLPEGKSVSLEKRERLRSAAMARIVTSRLCGDPTAGTGWIKVLGRFVAGIMGRVPWRAPPLPHSS